MDSNHRRRSRQIYSLIPLATREPLHGVLLVVGFQSQKTVGHSAELNNFQNDGGGRWIRTIEGGAVRFTV